MIKLDKVVKLTVLRLWKPTKGTGHIECQHLFKRCDWLLNSGCGWGLFWSGSCQLTTLFPQFHVCSSSAGAGEEMGRGRKSSSTVRRACVDVMRVLTKKELRNGKNHSEITTRVTSPRFMRTVVAKAMYENFRREMHSEGLDKLSCSLAIWRVVFVGQAVCCLKSHQKKGLSSYSSALTECEAHICVLEAWKKRKRKKEKKQFGFVKDLISVLSSSPWWCTSLI